MPPRHRHESDRSDVDIDERSHENWAIYSKVHHRLPLLDSPHPDGWTVKELAAEYNCSASWMANVMARLVRDGHALQTKEGRYIGP